MKEAAVPLWKRPLADLTTAEWESLCDGCGRCCLVKLEDEDRGDIHFTNVSCRLLDAGSCRCSNYTDRRAYVPDCVKLTPDLVASINWLPPTCAYRLVEEGRDLMWWHPLVSGSPDTVHEAGISIRARGTVSEDHVQLEAMPDHIVTWPVRWPKRSRRPPGADSLRKSRASAPGAPAGEDPVDPSPLRPKP